MIKTKCLVSLEQNVQPNSKMIPLNQSVSQNPRPWTNKLVNGNGQEVKKNKGTIYIVPTYVHTKFPYTFSYCPSFSFQ